MLWRNIGMRDILNWLLDRNKWLLALLYLFVIVFSFGEGINLLAKLNDWLSVHRLQKTVLQYNWIQLIPVIVMLIALVTYLRSVQIKNNDNKYRKFETTLQAEKYFNEIILESINHSIRVYSEFTVSKQGTFGAYTKVTYYNDKAFAWAVEKANFSLTFRQLNYLAAYTKNRMVDEALLYEHIGDDLRQFAAIKDFDKIADMFNESHRNMVDFRKLIEDNENYLGQKERIQDYEKRMAKSRKGYTNKKKSKVHRS